MDTEKKRKKYKLIKELLESGSLRDLSNIFEIISISVFAKDAQMTPKTVRDKFKNPRLWTINEIIKLSAIIEIKDDQLYSLFVSKIIPIKKPE